MILQALKEYYDRKAADPESGIAPPGWERKELPFVIVIDADGRVVRVEDTRVPDGKKLKTKAFLVPHSVKRSVGIASNLLWDNVEYATGIVCKGNASRVAEQHRAFLAALEDYADIPAVSAVVKCASRADWESVFASLDEKVRAEWLKVCPFVSFRMEGVGEPVFRDPEFVSRFGERAFAETGERRLCLVSGGQDVPETLHPAIKGVRDTNTTGGNIVSFNFDAANSFGKTQGGNAVVGKRAAFAYTTALNTLLGKDSRQKMQVGDATVVWWAERSGEPLEEGLIDFFAEPPKDDPDRNVQAVEALYRSVDTGAFAVDAASGRFYVLGLAPNAARISVRFWTVGTAAELATRFRQYFEDLEIARGPNDKKHLSLWRLLVSTAPLGKSENIAPNLAGETMRSILAGPETLLQAAIRRCVVEHAVPYARAKLIKGCLNRKLRNNNPKKEKELTVSLDKENTNTGYLLGRLFAVLEKIQTDANPGINATIRDKFYATASSSPVAVFANLMRLKNHHLAKIGGGGRVRYEQMIGEIAALLPPEFPAHLSLDDQGRFAIGYYHQNRDLWTSKKDKAESADKAAETTSTEN